MDLYMLTTTDNPFSPVTDYDAWLAWDLANYNTNSLLARVVRTSPELSDFDQALAIQEGIDEIVTENVSGVHKKIRAGSMPVPFEQEDSNSSSAATSAA
jgi:hypothetical protein